ncbi:MAG: hypothetical protein AAGA55_03780 [Planctomycetota bacterium]
MSHDPALRGQAAFVLGTYYPSAGNPKPDNLMPSRYAYPAVAAILAGTDPDPELTHTFMNSVGRRPGAVWRVLYGPDVERPLDPAIAAWAGFVHDREQAVERLTVDAGHPSWEVSVLALWGLLALDADTEASRRAIESAAGRPEATVRETALNVLGQLIVRGHAPFQTGPFAEGGGDPDARVRSAGREVLLGMEPMPAAGIEIVIDMLAGPQPAAGLAWAKRIEDRLDAWGAGYDAALLARLRAAAREARARTEESGAGRKKTGP